MLGELIAEHVKKDSQGRRRASDGFRPIFWSRNISLNIHFGFELVGGAQEHAIASGSQ
jgi:hypothetical protein